MAPHQIYQSDQALLVHSEEKLVGFKCWCQWGDLLDVVVIH
jgi:hypothetical protein